ncbi:MaoC family dehydratase N-terminal domain-containing protein [Variovorax sp. dw_954]|uniref:MaoC family dehydratase N-terminal domain-containing protein n=1 Tax=Variovorax sp. dw_954 TaxID=2720078 RepID=UPI001BD58227|nr:MaoC family dehydratase N-terminal domain-containing protein [Variovorax sp. dw_954]
MTDRSRVGFTTTPTRVRIDGWRVRLFCQATRETDPVYWDEALARAAGHRACPVPPTFLKAIEGEHFSSAQLMTLIEVPLRGVLHAEQSFDIHAPMHVGDEIEISRTVADIHDKKEGAFTFIVVDTHYRLGAQAAATSRQTILVRNAVQPA